jgi:simple sugar transport system permease protein
VLSVLAALSLGALLILLLGSNPAEVYRALLLDPFSSRTKFGGLLATLVPLLLSGLAVALAFRAGVFNLGVEGQLYLGAFAAAWVGFTLGLPGALLIPLALLGSALVGALYALLPGLLRAYAGANEIVTTIMLNYVAISFTGYLIRGPFKPENPGAPQSDPIAAAARLGRFLPPSRAHIGLFLALALAVALYFFLYRTTIGYELRMAGSNTRFAEYGGVNVARTVVTAMFLSGALGGLVGGVETLGVQYKFLSGFSPGYGFDGITVALLARVEPLAVPVAALLFAVLRAGSSAVQVQTDISREVVDILQAIIILFVTAEGLWAFARRRRSARAGQAERAAQGV